MMSSIQRDGMADIYLNDISSHLLFLNTYDKSMQIYNIKTSASDPSQN